MLLKSSGQITAYPTFLQAVLSDTVSTCREYKPTALNDKVKPYPLHAHPVQAGCKFIAKPLIYRKVGVQFRRFTVNRYPFLTWCRPQVVVVLFLVATTKRLNINNCGQLLCCFRQQGQI